MDLADQIVAAFFAAKQRRIESEEAAVTQGDWPDAEKGRRCVQLARGMYVHANGPNSVSAFTDDSRDGEIWGFMAFECLDSAAGQVNLPKTAEIIERDRHYFTLNW